MYHLFNDTKNYLIDNDIKSLIITKHMPFIDYFL